MPITKKHQVSKYFEDFEEFHFPEHYPLFSSSNYLWEEEEPKEDLLEEKPKVIHPIWRRLLAILRIKVH